MTFGEGMDRLQRETAGVRALVFGDLATGTVLRSVAEEGLQQEDHDALLAEAEACIGPACANLYTLATTDGAQTAPVLSRAILVGGGETKLFLRDGPGTGDVLCARLDPGADAMAIGDALADLMAAHA